MKSTLTYIRSITVTFGGKKYMLQGSPEFR